MLSMFGFIKKSLEDKGQLIAKYREWKNQLYNSSGFKKFEGSTITAADTVLLFSPRHQEFPVDLHAKSWELTCRIDVKSKSTSSSVNYPQRYIVVTSKAAQIITVKCGWSTFSMFEHVSRRGQSPAYKMIADKGSIKVGGANYLRLVYTRKTDTTGTLTGYYSLNGTSWTTLAGYNFTKAEDKDVILHGVGIYGIGPTSVPADSSSVPVGTPNRNKPI